MKALIWIQLLTIESFLASSVLAQLNALDQLAFID